MHFRGNFKEILKDRRLIVKGMWIKNICGVVEIHKNSRNPY